MSSSWIPALFALVAALAGVAVTYVLGTRKSSSSVLWDASESIRLALTARVEAQDAEIEALKSKVDVLTEKNVDMHRRLERLEQTGG